MSHIFTISSYTLADVGSILFHRLVSYCLFTVLLFTVTSVEAITQVFNHAAVSAGTNSPDADVSNFNYSGELEYASLTSNFGSSSFTGSALADSTYGVLRGSASVNIVNYAPESYTTALYDPVYANSFIRDDITINDPIKNGTYGYLELSFDITGTTTLNYTSNLNGTPTSAQGSLTVYSDSQFVKSWGFSGSTTLTSPLIQFTYGTPFELGLSGKFFVKPWDELSSSLQLGDTWSLSGLVDFGNTINLSELAIFDDIGGTQIASGYDVSASSGTLYPTSVIPLPASAWLFCSGLLGLLGVSRRKKSA